MQSTSSFGMDGFRGGIAHYDSRKDVLITELPSFGPAVEALLKVPAVQALFGANEVGRIALQFVFNSYSHAANKDSAEVAFERVQGAQRFRRVFLKMDSWFHGFTSSAISVLS